MVASSTDRDKLSQFRLSLYEKLEALKLLDSEIVELTPDEGLEAEIGQADEYKETVHRALTMIDKVLSATPRPSITAADAHAKLSLPHFS